MGRPLAPEALADARQRILEAALVEFGDKGFAGARMDAIARVAKVNKQLLYHYYVSKDGLYQAVLRSAYLEFRGDDARLRAMLADLDAVAALRAFVEYLFKPTPASVRFQLLIQDENRFGACHVRDLAEAREAYARLMEVMAEILLRGAREGVFKAGLDPVELYISIAGLFMFRISNAHTLSAMLGVSLDTDEGAHRSRQTTLDFLLSAIRP